MTMNDKKHDIMCLSTFSNRIEAEIAKGVLDSNKITAFVESDDAGGMYPFPFSTTTGGVKLLIRKTDEVKAKKLLQNKS